MKIVIRKKKKEKAILYSYIIVDIGIDMHIVQVCTSMYRYFKDMYSQNTFNIPVPNCTYQAYMKKGIYSLNTHQTG